jgi:hypothetical protein
MALVAWALSVLRAENADCRRTFAHVRTAAGRDVHHRPLNWSALQMQNDVKKMHFMFGSV